MTGISGARSGDYNNYIKNAETEIKSTNNRIRQFNKDIKGKGAQKLTPKEWNNKIHSQEINLSEAKKSLQLSKKMLEREKGQLVKPQKASKFPRISKAFASLSSSAESKIDSAIGKIDKELKLIEDESTAVHKKLQPEVKGKKEPRGYAQIKLISKHLTGDERTISRIGIEEEDKKLLKSMNQFVFKYADVRILDKNPRLPDWLQKKFLDNVNKPEAVLQALKKEGVYFTENPSQRSKTGIMQRNLAKSESKPAKSNAEMLDKAKVTLAQDPDAFKRLSKDVWPRGMRLNGARDEDDPKIMVSLQTLKDAHVEIDSFNPMDDVNTIRDVLTNNSGASAEVLQRELQDRGVAIKKS